MKGHTGTIRTLSFQHQQYTASAPILLASAGAGDNRPRLWDVATGTMTGTRMVYILFLSFLKRIIWFLTLARLTFKLAILFP